MRTAEVTRKTRETEITMLLGLDGEPRADVGTGVGFFDHMLTAFAIHGGFSLSASCSGDLAVDCHHTVEDCGIVLGKALAQALGDRSGIARYGAASIPMDEALATASIDVSGRPWLVFSCEFTTERIGELDTQMIEEFFRAFAMNAGITLHLRLAYGSNDHHKAEALFKACAHALRQAVAPREGLLSTKGTLV